MNDSIVSYKNIIEKLIILYGSIETFDGWEKIGMQVKNLTAFLAVARTLNFGEASRQLSYAQSTVSAQVQALEKELDTRLFERIGRRVFLTDAGRQLLPLAQKMVISEENIRHLFQDHGKVAGRIRIGASETLCAFWLPPLLKAYGRRYPDVDVCIKVGYCTDFPAGLAADRIDTAFSLHDEAGSALVRQRVLFKGRTLFIVAPDHPWAGCMSVPLADLAGQPLLLPEGETGYPMELKELLRDHGIAARTILEFGSLDAIKQCAKSGLGVSLLPEIAVKEELARGELSSFAVQDVSIPLQAQMLFYREKWLSPQLAALEKLAAAWTQA
jgi:DNA-binding transcriptional LysR family regulator